MAKISEVEVENSIPQVSETSKKVRKIKSGVQKLVWIISHYVILIGSGIELLTYIFFQKNTLVSLYLYHFIFVAAAVGYAASLLNKLQGQIPTLYALLPQDNFQYGFIAFVWIFYPRRIVKLIPFVVFSVLQVGDQLGMKSFVNKHHLRLAKLAAQVNLVVLLSLVTDFLRLRHGSSISLFLFGLFYRIRIAYSPVTFEVIQDIIDYIDNFVNSNNKISPNLKKRWAKVKWALDHSERSQLVKDKSKPKPKPKVKKPITGGLDSKLFLEDDD